MKRTMKKFNESSDYTYRAKIGDKLYLQGNSQDGWDTTSDSDEAAIFESKTEPTQIINQMKKDNKIRKNDKITVMKEYVSNQTVNAFMRHGVEKYFHEYVIVIDDDWYTPCEFINEFELEDSFGPEYSFENVVQAVKSSINWLKKQGFKPDKDGDDESYNLYMMIDFIKNIKDSPNQLNEKRIEIPNSYPVKKDEIIDLIERSSRLIHTATDSKTIQIYIYSNGSDRPEALAEVEITSAGYILHGAEGYDYQGNSLKEFEDDLKDVIFHFDATTSKRFGENTEERLTMANIRRLSEGKSPKWKQRILDDENEIFDIVYPIVNDENGEWKEPEKYLSFSVNKFIAFIKTLIDTEKYSENLLKDVATSLWIDLHCDSSVGDFDDDLEVRRKYVIYHNLRKELWNTLCEEYQEKYGIKRKPQSYIKDPTDASEIFDKFLSLNRELKENTMKNKKFKFIIEDNTGDYEWDNYPLVRDFDGTWEELEDYLKTTFSSEDRERLLNGDYILFDDDGEDGRIYIKETVNLSKENKLFENGGLFDYVLNESLSSSLKETVSSLEWLLDKAYVSEYRMVGKNSAEVRVRHTPELLTSDSMAARFGEDIPDGYKLEVDYLGEDPVLGRNFDIYEVQLMKE